MKESLVKRIEKVKHDLKAVSNVFPLQARYLWVIDNNSSLSDVNRMLSKKGKDIKNLGQILLAEKLLSDIREYNKKVEKQGY